MKKPGAPNVAARRRTPSPAASRRMSSPRRAEAPRTPPRKLFAGGEKDAEAQKRELRNQFQLLDKNKDGTLSFDELRGLLKRLNVGLSAHNLQQIFCTIDKNHNGRVELDEFIEWMFGDRSSSAPDRSLDDLVSATSAAVDAIGAEPPDLDDKWKQSVLDVHNMLRTLHGAPAMTWSDECYAEAKKQADACQAKSSLFHGHLRGRSGRHGQNCYWRSQPGATPEEATYSWYGEIEDPGYDFSNPGFTSGIGHFTQVVWKESTQVGLAQSEDGRFTVANYYPAGNMMGKFPENVLPPSEDLPKVDLPGARLVPQRSRGGGDNQVANGTDRRSVTAESWTPELEELFSGTPLKKMTEQIKQAFEKDGRVKVTVTKYPDKEEGKWNVEALVYEGDCIIEMGATYVQSCNTGGG